MTKLHQYSIHTSWTGNNGEGTKGYRSYSRNHEINVIGKPVIAASSDPAFLGDNTKYNPEEMLVASLSSCHMLWYLHLCSDAGVVVTSYEDHATGTMEETPNGSGRFTEVTLHPLVKVKDASMVEAAGNLHHQAHTMCFIANSVNFEVACKSEIRVEDRCEV